MEGPHSSSFSILVPFSSINKKASKQQNAVMQRTLSSIIAQNQIRQQNLQYQHLLIRRKELQIEMEGRKNELDLLIKKRKKADKVVEEAINRRNQASLNCKEKRCYLEKYYQELDRKFKGGKEELFNNLAKLEQSLLQAYQQDEKKLKDSLISDQQEFTRLVSLVGVQRQKRDYLRSELNRMQQSLQSQSFGIQKGGQNNCSQLRNENNYLKMQLQRFNKEKKKLQSQEKILKKILNIEEEHKKHSSNIQNGIKKIFSIKLKEQRYRAAVSPDYEKNIQGLKDIIAKKKLQKDTLLQQINQKKSRLDSIVRDVNEKNREYGQLQQRLIRKSNN